MIDIEYTNEIKVETKELDKVFPRDLLPLKLEIRNSISDESIWNTNLDSYTWATFPNSEMNDVQILDTQNNFVLRYKWEVCHHGSYFYKSLWYYCKRIINTGKRPIGIAIGTHDGEFGEWCPLVKDNLSDIILVEASQKQFDKLKKNYESKIGLEFVNELITTNGEEVEFFEGGRGYTNSIVERVIRNWEKEEIKKTIRKSISINNLINSYSNKLDWIHFDVEGLDAQLIMSLEEKNLPNFIIFEDENLEEFEKVDIQKFLVKNGYKLDFELGKCMATKN